MSEDWNNTLRCVNYSSASALPNVLKSELPYVQETWSNNWVETTCSKHKRQAVERCYKYEYEAWGQNWKCAWWKSEMISNWPKGNVLYRVGIVFYYVSSQLLACLCHPWSHLSLFRTLIINNIGPPKPGLIPSSYLLRKRHYYSDAWLLPSMDWDNLAEKRRREAFRCLDPSAEPRLARLTSKARRRALDGIPHRWSFTFHGGGVQHLLLRHLWG